MEEAEVRLDCLLEDSSLEEAVVLVVGSERSASCWEAVLVVELAAEPRPAALWRRYLTGSRGSREWWISREKLLVLGLLLLSEGLSPCRDPTYIPKLNPTDEVGVVHLPLRIDVLSGSHHHGLIGRDVDERSFPRVRVRHPYRHGKPVGAAAEADGDRAREVNEQCTGSIGEGWRRISIMVISQG